MHRLIVLTCASALIAGSAFAQENAAPAAAPAAPESAPAPAAAPATPVADPDVYQVLRPGDREMSCEALAAEANSLNAVLLAEQKEDAKKKGRSKAGRQVAGGVAGGVLKGAGRFGLSKVIGGMTPFGGVVAVAVNDAAADAAGRAIATSGPASQGPELKPEQQRMNHLLGLYREKSC